jgi:signal transduction histidine kinase
LKNTLIEQDAVIKSDKEKIHSILTNLVKNAIKFCDKGKIEVGCLKKENELQIHVKDSGIGIPRKKQQVIFERFIQSDIEDKNALQGPGLGLAISKSYVEMLGGKIWVESEEGKGSTFFFTIPNKT